MSDSGKALAQKYANTFGTVDGKLVLSDLRAMFYDVPNMAGKSAHEATVAAARHEVISHILSMIEEA